MMDAITQLHGTTPEQLTETIFKGIDERLEGLKKDFQPREPEEFLSRKETAALLKISLVCLHDWCNKKLLKPRKFGNRTYFLRSEINETMLNSNT